MRERRAKKRIRIPARNNQNPSISIIAKLSQRNSEQALLAAVIKTTMKANHWLFQLANLCLLLSYSAKDVLILRVLLMGAGLFFVLWGSIVLSVSVDTVAWNSVFTIINAYRATEVAWSRRPVKFDREEHDKIYNQVFGPLGIGRLEFKLMVEEGLLRKIRAGTTFLEAGNEANNLSLIYSGTMDIISAPKDGRPPEQVGTLHPMQFVESPQWARAGRLRKTSRLGSSNRNIDQNIDKNTEDEELGFISNSRYDAMREASTVDVTFIASTDVVFYTWPIERLLDFMWKHPNVTAPINAVIGNDVASKLFSQGKGCTGETSSNQRRIYLPMDELEEPAIFPCDDNNKTYSETSENETQTAFERSPIRAEQLWLERRGAKDTANDKSLATILRQRTSLNQFELSALLSKGRWRNILREGTVLIREGEPTTFLIMLLEGNLSVHKGEGGSLRRLHTILRGQLVGSIEMNEPEREHLAGQTVTALVPCTYIQWDLDDLRELLKPRPRLRAHLTALIATDLSAKLRQVEETISCTNAEMKRETARSP